VTELKEARVKSRLRSAGLGQNLFCQCGLLTLYCFSRLARCINSIITADAAFITLGGTPAAT
jgi:hypothetical protein